MASESEDDSSDDDRLGSQPGPFRSAPRHPSSHAPPSVQSYRPQPRPGSISATEGYNRGGPPPSRSQISTSAQYDNPHALRSRGPPSLQGGYSRPQYAPQSTAASVAGSSYPRQPEYQRSTYAASSVGGRSVGTRTGPPSIYPPRPPSNAGTAQHQPRAEMESALQSIQASLAALHERLNRVESRSGAGGADDPRRSRPGSALYNAIINIVDDFKQLLGLNGVARGQRSEALAPSFLAQGGGGGSADRSNAAFSLLTSPVRILVALVNLSARLALDVISLVLVSSFFLYAFKRITGRGDPLLMIRLLKRLQQAVLRRSPAAKQLVAEASM